MRPGTPVTMTVAIADPRRMRYETFDRNRNTPLPTYNRRGTVTQIHWKTKQATVRWTDGTITRTNIGNLKEAAQI